MWSSRAHEQRIPIGEFGTVAGQGGKVLFGVWPEDIEVGAADAAGASMGTVYAVDNRGFERAIQVDTPGGSFRKVMPLSMPFTQGDACSFRVPQGGGFLFDAAGGRRISQAEFPLMGPLFSKKWFYRLATVLILGGFAMLCQPFHAPLVSSSVFRCCLPGLCFS